MSQVEVLYLRRVSKVSQKRLDWTGACAIRLYGFGPIGELSQVAGQVEPAKASSLLWVKRATQWVRGSTTIKREIC